MEHTDHNKITEDENPKTSSTTGLQIFDCCLTSLALLMIHKMQCQTVIMLGNDNLQLTISNLPFLLRNKKQAIITEFSSPKEIISKNLPEQRPAQDEYLHSWTDSFAPKVSELKGTLTKI